MPSVTDIEVELEECVSPMFSISRDGVAKEDSDTWGPLLLLTLGGGVVGLDLDPYVETDVLLGDPFRRNDAEDASVEDRDGLSGSY